MLNSLLWWGIFLYAPAGLAKEGQTWKYVSKLSEEELRFVDLL